MHRPHSSFKAQIKLNTVDSVKEYRSIERPAGPATLIADDRSLFAIFITQRRWAPIHTDRQ